MRTLFDGEDVDDVVVDMAAAKNDGVVDLWLPSNDDVRMDVGGEGTSERTMKDVVMTRTTLI